VVPKKKKGVGGWNPIWGDPIQLELGGGGRGHGHLKLGLFARENKGLMGFRNQTKRRGNANPKKKKNKKNRGGNRGAGPEEAFAFLTSGFGPVRKFVSGGKKRLGGGTCLLAGAPIRMGGFCRGKTKQQTFDRGRPGFLRPSGGDHNVCLGPGPTLVRVSATENKSGTADGLVPPGDQKKGPVFSSSTGLGDTPAAARPRRGGTREKNKKILGVTGGNVHSKKRRKKGGKLHVFGSRKTFRGGTREFLRDALALGLV